MTEPTLTCPNRTIEILLTKSLATDLWPARQSST